MSEYRLGIAVVTYRSTTTLPDCLASIRRHCPDSVVVVVENSGDVGIVTDHARAAAPLDVEVIDPGGNIGYARGVNLAAARILTRDCSHLLILNPDVQVTADPHSLVPYLDHADVVAGILVEGASRDVGSGDGTIVAGNVKREITWGTSLLQSVVGTRFNGIGSVPAGQALQVPQVDGAYMLQTLEYYQRHLLDEDFELYFEDVDYCDRARRARGVVLVALPVGVHTAGASAAQSSGLAYAVNRVSRARYLRRKYPQRPRALLAVPFALELLVRSATRQGEGWGTRRRACSLALQELRTPGRVRVLDVASAPAAVGTGARRLGTGMVDDPCD